MTDDALSFDNLLRLHHDRDERDRQGLAFVDGIRFVMRAAERPAAIVGLVAANKLLDSAAARRLLREATVPITRLSAEQFRRLSIAPQPQGIGALVRQHVRPLDDGAAARQRFWVCFEAVRSPGNLGTIARTCEAAGAGIILLGSALDPYDPQVVRASMGSLIAVRIVRTTAALLHAWKHRNRVQVVGATAEARRDYRKPRYAGALVLMIGSERRGMSPAQRSLCDTMVRIPMVGRTDSLNVAVATSLLLYEAYRCRWPVQGDGG